MNIKESRPKSFIAVSLIYVVASLFGIWVYNVLSFDIWLNLLIADVMATVLTFVFSLIFSNASVYDPYWSVQPIVIIIAFALGESLSLAKALVIAAVLLWGVRLTANWAYTFHGLNHQDWRYTMLSEQTGRFYPLINFIGIHMVPTLVVYFATLPGVYVILSDAKGGVLAILSFLVCLTAVALQFFSDCQMHRYRIKRETPFIRIGLWKHSRHPNYLGEIMMWWGIALISVSSIGFHWFSFIGAIANTLLFLFVSVPMADRRQSCKAGFAEYKSQTRMFIPIAVFNKKA